MIVSQVKHVITIVSLIIVSQQLYGTSITFIVDMSEVAGTPAGFISGDFNGFSIDEMTSIGSNQYSYTVDIADGTTVRYFFLSSDASDFSGKESIPDCGQSDPQNRRFTAGTSSETVSNFFGSCTDPTLTVFRLDVNTIGNGDVSLNPSGGVYNSGDNVELTATAQSGNVFTGWSDDITSTTNPIVLTMDEDKLVTATFKALVAITFVVDMSEVVGTPAGFISGDFNGFTIESMTSIGGNQYSYTVDIPEDSTVRYFFLSSDASDFSGKESIPDCGQSDPQNRRFTAGASSETVSNFFGSCTDPALTVYRLDITTIGNGDVSLNPSGGVYNSGDIVTLTATAQSGNVFIGWSDAITSTNNPIVLTMDEDKLVTATFKALVAITFVVDMSEVVGTPAGFISGDFNGFTIESMTSIGGNQYSYTVDIPEDSTVRYFFLSSDASDFSGKESIPDCGQSDPQNRRFTAGTSSETVSNFFGSCTDPALTVYRLDITTIGNGDVSLNPSGGVYNSGDIVTLTATAQSGNVFIGWSDAITSTNNPIVLTMDEDKLVTATFKALVAITFVVDMSEVVGTPAGFISGDFNGFTIESMTSIGGNQYSYTVDIPEDSTVRYFFLSSDASDFSGKESIPDCGQSDPQNRRFTAGAFSETVSQPFSECEDPALPVEWLSFEVKFEDNKVKLLWATASEINNDRFEIQHSIDGYTFNYIGEIKGAGTKNQSSFYLFEHQHGGKQEISYYRIRQVDFDGNSSFSKVQSIHVPSSSEPVSVSVFPNPVEGHQIFFQVKSVQRESPLQVALINNSGKVLITKTFGDTVNMVKDLSVETLSPGFYYLHVQRGNTREIIKVVKR